MQSFIGRARVTHCAGKALENRFDLVVIRSAVHYLRVQISSGVIDEAAEEIFEQFSLQIADVNHVNLLIVDQRRPAAEIDRDNGKRFVHGLHKITSAVNAAAVAESL